MASARYDVLISQEDIAPPQEKVLSSKEKWQNFWHYNKFVVLGSFVAIAIITSIIYSIVTTVKPDYNIGFIHPYAIDAEIIDELQLAFSKVLNDTNGDGKVSVRVSAYQLPLDNSVPEDILSHTANTTKFIGDIQTNETFLYLTLDPITLQTQFELLADKQGNAIVDATTLTADDIGILWDKHPVLSELSIGTIVDFSTELEVPIQNVLQGYYVVQRYVDADKFNLSKKQQHHYEQNKLLFETLLQQAS